MCMSVTIQPAAQVFKTQAHLLAIYERKVQLAIAHHAKSIGPDQEICPRTGDESCSEQSFSLLKVKVKVAAWSAVA